MHIDLTATRYIASTPASAYALTLDCADWFPALFRGYGPIPALTRITPQAAPAVGATRTVDSADGARMTERITALEASRRHAYTLEGIRPPLAWLARVWAMRPARSRPSPAAPTSSGGIASNSPRRWPGRSRRHC